ncbi:MAG: DUF2079 domain-containing protein [Anaerolineae bacterium]|jgi:uncharacterized membrane protein
MSGRLARRAVPVTLVALILMYSVWFTFLSFRRYEALDTGGLDLGNMDQATWNTLHGCFLCETNIEGVDNRLAHHVEPIFLLIAPLYLIHSGPRTLLLLQAVVVALGALPVYWIARDRLKNRWGALAFAAAYLLFPALQAATLDEFHPVTLAPTLLLFAFYFLGHDKPIGYFAFLVLALGCKEEISLMVALLGLYILFVRRDWKLGLATALLGLCWFLVAVYVVIPRFNPEGSSPFLAYYEQLGENPLEMAWTLITQPRLALALVVTRQNLQFLWGMLAPVGLSPLWPLVVGLALLLIGRRSSLAPWQSLRVVVEPLLLMLVALPSVSINLLSSNEWMHQVNVSHHSVPGVPFFVLAGILGAAGARSQLRTLNRPGPARVAGFVRGSLLLVGMAMALLYHRQQGFTPLAAGFRPVPLTDHHRRVTEIVPLIPPKASVTTSYQVNSQVSHRRWLHLWPNLHDADYVFLDVVPSVIPLIANDVYQGVQELLQSGEYGVRVSWDGFLLLEGGLDSPAISDDFYSFARAGTPAIQYPMRVRYGESLELLGFDADSDRTASISLTLYFRVQASTRDDYRFFVFFTDAAGNTAAEQPPLTAPIQYPLSQELVVTRWYPPSQWQTGEIVQAETWLWTLAKPTEVGIALGVVDGPGQWELDQRVPPIVVEPGHGVRPVQGGTLLHLAILRSDGRNVTMHTPQAGPQNW